MSVLNPLETPQSAIRINPLTSRTSFSTAFLLSPSNLSPISSPSSPSSSPLNSTTDSLSDISQHLALLQGELSSMKQSVVSLQQENSALRQENKLLKSKGERDTLQCRSLLTSLENQNARNALLLQETQRLSALHSPPKPLDGSHTADPSPVSQFVISLFLVLVYVNQPAQSFFQAYSKRFGFGTKETIERSSSASLL